MTAVLAVPVVVFGESEAPAAEVVPSPPLVLSVGFPITDEGVTAASEEALASEHEEALSEEAEARATSTTTTSSTTTTTVPVPASSDTTSAAAPPAKSSGSGSSAASPTTTQPKAAPSTTQPPPPPPSGSYNSGMESDFYGRINALRAANGKAALSANGSLASYARSWAKWMGDNATLAHSNIGSLVPPWSSVGENVGQGGSVSGVFSALAGSSGHLSNMLGDFTHVGVGVWVDSGGTIWTVHVFAG